METNQTLSQKAQPAVSLHQSNILIMDTDVVHLKLVSKMLGKIGYPVVFAKDYKEAQNILDTHNIDFILLDVKMQKSNGFDITQVAREKEKSLGRRIPIVALTDKNIKAYREKCLADGLDECLPKPVFETELCRVIGKLSNSTCQSDS